MTYASYDVVTTACDAQQATTPPSLVLGRVDSRRSCNRYISLISVWKTVSRFLHNLSVLYNFSSALQLQPWKWIS